MSDPSLSESDTDSKGTMEALDDLGGSVIGLAGAGVDGAKKMVQAGSDAAANTVEGAGQGISNVEKSA
jgi:hypothetical protein